MTLWTVIGNILNGKPAFSPEPENDNSTDQPKVYDQDHTGHENTPSPTPQHKIIPRVIIDRIDCHIAGKYMTCYANIVNESDVDIEIDRILLFNMTLEIDRTLRAHHEQIILVYKGPVIQSDDYKRCELRYKDMTGDYFMSPHNIEFQLLHDGNYIVHKVRVDYLKDV